MKKLSYAVGILLVGLSLSLKAEIKSFKDLVGIEGVWVLQDISEEDLIISGLKKELKILKATRNSKQILLVYLEGQDKPLESDRIFPSKDGEVCSTRILMKRSHSLITSSDNQSGIFVSFECSSGEIISLSAYTQYHQTYFHGMMDPRMVENGSGKNWDYQKK